MVRFLPLFLCCAILAAGQSLMPLPRKLTPGEGRLAIDGKFRVALAGYTEPRLEAAAARLTSQLSRMTGILFAAAAADPATLVIDVKGAAEAVQSLREDESYTLEVTAGRARIEAANPLGALRGLATFLELVEPGQDGFAAPAVRIEDQPRFPWRGLMIDSARHFLPVALIERNLDGMAAVKLNVLHLHLSDNQGFRVESQRYPKLHELGSDGLYYTQDQVRHIIAYARERGIRVLPEFDMPGHTTAWFVGYPELASAPGPYQIERGWGVHDPAMDPTRDETYEFLDGFVTEMAALFADRYFHIGGDEVNGKQWNANPRIQEFKRAHGMKTNPQLQAYFNKRLVEILARHGKQMVGWDEVLEPGLAKGIVVQSWRGQRSLAAAARQGYQGILSSGLYLDLMFPASVHYAVDPLAGAASPLTEAEKSLVLGGEACEWTEYADAENLDARIWPRMAAIAERFWSPAEAKDADSMYRRLAAASARLEYAGLTHATAYRTMTERIAGYRPAPALATLLAIVEPVKEYAREGGRKYTQFTPLNRAVDVARPESDVAREFSKQVEALLAGDSSGREAVRHQLVAWRDQHAELKPVFERSFLAAEIEPLSATVAALAGAGIEALDYAGGKPGGAAWAEGQRALLERAKQPQAELLISILPAIRSLVAAAAK
jgi:hexosaminidase